MPERIWQTVPVKGNGYIQSVDEAALLLLARKKKTIVRMERGIGEFVVHNTPLASLALNDPPEEKLVAALQAVYSIDRDRTLEQDSAFGIRQIVDMALRALSPGTNDTTTAVMCVDYLAAILARVASRNIPSSHRVEERELRVITIGPTFAGLVAESFDQFARVPQAMSPSCCGCLARFKISLIGRPVQAGGQCFVNKCNGPTN